MNWQSESGLRYVRNPREAFIDFTEHMVDVRKDYSGLISFNINQDELDLVPELDQIWDKEQKRCGEWLQWREWLLNCAFPVKLFEDIHGGDMDSLIEDDRFYDPPKFQGFDTWNTFMGRAFRPRPNIPQGFLQYAIDRWRAPRLRAMPSFYFDTESPEWIWEELARNPTQPKSGRGSVSCVTNISMRWDTKTQTAYYFLILKHNNWSHVYGDIFGAAYFWKAFLDHIGLECKREVRIFYVSSTMDKLKEARETLEFLDG